MSKAAGGVDIFNVFAGSRVETEIFSSVVPRPRLPKTREKRCSKNGQVAAPRHEKNFQTLVMQNDSGWFSWPDGMRQRLAAKEELRKLIN